MSRLLALLLVACLSACSSASAIHPVRSVEQEWVGVAAGADSLLTVMHPPHVGQRVRVWVRWRWVPAVVSAVSAHGLVTVRGEHESLDLEPGDSGSPVIDGGREIIAAIVGGREIIAAIVDRRECR